MTRIAVDQLTIRAPGLTPEEGRRLARLLADGLQRGADHSSAGHTEVDELAGRVLEQLVAELRRRT
jgi:hypothetical protein